MEGIHILRDEDGSEGKNGGNCFFGQGNCTAEGFEAYQCCLGCFNGLIVIDDDGMKYPESMGIQSPSYRRSRPPFFLMLLILVFHRTCQPVTDYARQS